jgi:serine/threonine protein kinase/formylglycine-generating enzyme required for sulfatase activity
MIEGQERLEGILGRALELSPAEREVYVDAAAAGDPRLKEEVLSLLAHHSDEDGFLETPLSPAAGETDESESPAQAPASNGAYGQYRILRQLGEGGMGVVYLAEQLQPVERRVALKVLKPGMDTRQVVSRFRREQQTLALMSHPGLAQVFDAGATPDGRPYFVMEHVDGVRITDFCQARRLSVAERLRLFVRLCDAVGHAHQKGIIHRDLKPSNILVVPGPIPRPKIIDFGIARATERSPGTLHTEHGMLVGTPHYMSPEQADPSGRAVDTRSDVYSLGVVLHELLLGVLPRPAEPGRASGALPLHRDVDVRHPPSQLLGEPQTPLDRLAEQRSTDRRGLVRQVTGDLDAILLKALRRDVDERYSTVAELAADIGRFLDHEPVLARTPTLAYRLRKLVAKNRAFFVAVALVFLLLALSSVVSTSLYLVNKKQRDRIFRLSDHVVLKDVVGEANALWPAHPERIPAMEAWLGGSAADLVARVPAYRARLRELEAQAAAGGRDVSAETAFELGLLRELAAELEAFAKPQVGPYAQVEERLAFARSVRRRSLEDHAERWAEATASIADRGACPMYDGLRLPPQLGLVPLGRDPESKLWEFAHLQTGEVPERDAAGRLVIDEGTGLVFVLIPSGSFRMGAVKPDETHRPGDPNVDEIARSDEGPVHTLTIRDPFFLSKYEMTQGQWLRITHHNPAYYPAGQRFAGVLHTLLHPQDFVTWTEADRLVTQLGLVLPTEAQWEYAARAGTSTPWWTGEHYGSLAGAANIADDDFARDAQAPDDPGPWQDGYTFTAPVGRFRANPFGLHDVHGNVIEWCRDDYGSYELEARDSDGMRLATSDTRTARGGCYSTGRDCRIARRVNLRVHKEQDAGLRPARAIEWEPEQSPPNAARSDGPAPP